MWLRRGGKSCDRGPIFRVSIFTGSPEFYDADIGGTVPTAKQAIWLLLIICHTRFGLMERLWGIFIVCSLLLSVDYCWGQTTTRVDGCFSVQFACVDGSRCPPLVNNRNGVCDGVYDCGDQSDEARCGLGSCTPLQYQCDNGNCVMGSDVCNGQDNCGDNSDETQCGRNDLTNFIASLSVGLTGGFLVLLLSLIGCICCCVHNCCMKHKKNINGPATTTQTTPKSIDKNVDSQLVYYNSETGSTFI